MFLIQEQNGWITENIASVFQSLGPHQGLGDWDELCERIKAGFKSAHWAVDLSVSKKHLEELENGITI